MMSRLDPGCGAVCVPRPHQTHTTFQPAPPERHRPEVLPKPPSTGTVVGPYGADEWTERRLASSRKRPPQRHVGGRDDGIDRGDRGRSAGRRARDRRRRSRSPTGFLAELAVAMRATAEKERERIAARVVRGRRRPHREGPRASRDRDGRAQAAGRGGRPAHRGVVGGRDGAHPRRGGQEDRRSALEPRGVPQAARLDHRYRDRGRERRGPRLQHDARPVLRGARAVRRPGDDRRARRSAAGAARPRPGPRPGRASAVAVFADQEDEAAASEAAPEPIAADTTDAAGIAGGVATTASGETATAVADQADEISNDASAEARAETTGDAATSEALTADATAEARAETTGDAATSEALTADATAEATAVPVMDPDATANPSWPSAPDDAEPVEVAASADHTSAAVRLLRSVAPWTAPTHAGSDDRTDAH